MKTLKTIAAIAALMVAGTAGAADMAEKRMSDMAFEMARCAGTLTAIAKAGQSESGYTGQDVLMIEDTARGYKVAAAYTMQMVMLKQYGKTAEMGRVVEYQVDPLADEEDRKILNDLRRGDYGYASSRIDYCLAIQPTVVGVVQLVRQSAAMSK